MSLFSLDQIKNDFPGLTRNVNDHKITFLDSAASSQTPIQVIEAMNNVYNDHYANVHRGVYITAQEVSDEYEASRKTVAAFINASTKNEIVFTRNATESINLVARSWGEENLKQGDVILLTHLEHHSNIVPWQQLAEKTGAVIKWVNLDSKTHLDLSSAQELLKGAKIFAFTAASNVTGTLTPVEELVKMAKEAGALTVVDACQLVPHKKVDVQQLGADFIAFSAHKMLGPTGLGILWGKESLLNEMPPFLGGGSMISDVTTEGFDSAELPAKFEAGTPAFIEAIGTAKAIEYLNALDFEKVDAWEKELTQYTLKMFEENFASKIYVHGPISPAERLGVFSFSVKDIHPHDVSQLLDEYGVCVRAGHHCAKPLMRVLEVDGKQGIGATSRASVYVYNTFEDIDNLGNALEKALAFFGVN